MRKSSGKPKDIGASLFGKGRRKVLGVLFSRPEQPMYLREIIGAVGGGQGQVQRELEQLHRAGLVLREKRANLVYYRPNPDAPIYDELKAIAFKTFGVADVLRELLKPLAKRIGVAFIYGSVARQEDTARSDVDVMVVGDVKFSDVVLALSGAQERLRREINPSVYSKAELRAKLKEKGGFLDRVMAGTKLFLIGNDDDLGQLVENRKAKASPAEAR
jgi:predicted nucleotidyltransferase